jgi:uncharacterized protein (TIGR01777 family)
MRVFLTGGTGRIGRGLVQALQARGDAPVVLSRHPEKARRLETFRDVEFVGGDPGEPGDWQTALNGCDAVINLVGHDVFAERWSAVVKRKIRDSRVLSTQNLVSAMEQAEAPPKVLVQGSAIGYYGATGDAEVTETSPSGQGFMAEVCIDWESAAAQAERMGARVSYLRTGIVLSPEGGALKVMTPIFRWLPGGAAPVGSRGTPLPALGRQWMSWIHRDDITGLFLLALDHPGAVGPINGTAPLPVRNQEFSRELARAVHRPFLPFGPPDFVLRLVLGEVAGAVAEGQRILPAKARSLGYSFRFPELRGALADLVA